MRAASDAPRPTDFVLVRRTRSSDEAVWGRIYPSHGRQVRSSDAAPRRGQPDTQDGNRRRRVSEGAAIREAVLTDTM